MNNAVIFASLAILFALLNIVLWSFVWKNFSGCSGRQMKDVNDENSKIEDQLWGVLDRIKELEQSISGIEKEISNGTGFGDEKNKAISKLIALNKKTAALVQTNSNWLNEITESIKQLKKIPGEYEKLDNIFESIEKDVARLSGRIEKLEK